MIPASLLHVALAASTAAMSMPAVASARSTSQLALVAAIAEAPASVLGLEGTDTKATEDLTVALRRAFEKHGYAGGEEITLAELRLTMGCEGNDQACLASGGEALQVRRLVYGKLSPAAGGNYSLELSILNVADGMVEKNTTTPVKAADLQPDVIDATATAIVDAMFPQEIEGTELPGPTGPAIGPETGDPGIQRGADKPRRESKLVWGPYKPRPTWKWATFGTSAGLMGLSAIAVAITGIPVVQSNRGKGFLYERLEKEARASLTNDEPLDDVDPDEVLDICADTPGSGGALEVLRPPQVEDEGVRNATVGKECQNGKNWARVATASGIALGAFALTTAVFTTLLFVHRRNPASAAVRRHQVQVGAAPDLEGRGLSFTGSFRF